MNKQASLAAVVVAAALSFPLPSGAQSQTRGAIQGSQLMTQQERARARSITLPDEPPAHGGGGMGPGGGGPGGR